MAAALTLLLAAFAPGLFLVWFFVRLDKTRPEPLRLLVGTFALGCLSTLPAGLLYEFLGFDVLWFAEELPFLPSFLLMMFVVGPVEELCKFGAVRLGAYRSLYFDEPLDGLVYASVASLGFASLENLYYVIEYGLEVMLVRAPLSTLGHLVFGSIWGYALGQHYASGRQRGWLLVGSLALAAAVHGTFNVLLSYFPLMTLAYPLVGGVLVYRAFRKGDAASPYSSRRNYPLVHCNRCDQTLTITQERCPNCGALRPLAGSTALLCGSCGNSNPFDASFCTACGDELMLEYAASAQEDTELVDEPAGFWVRFLAFLIDGITAAGLYLFILFNYGIFLGLQFGDGAFDSVEPSLFVSLTPLVFLVYHTALVAIWGTTAGKRLFRLYVVRKDGSRVGPGRALARFLASVVPGIGLLMVAFRQDKQGLEDLVCNTMVVRRSRRPVVAS